METSGIVPRLIAAGLAPSIARLLVSRYGEDRCARHLDFLPFREDRSGAALRQAIEEDAPAPARIGFLRQQEETRRCMEAWAKLPRSQQIALLRASARKVPPVVRRLAAGRPSHMTRGCTITALREVLAGREASDA